ncbi:MAG TPA: hypothetical protein VI146_02075 [Nitrososphaeraceae archaeon]
MITRSGLLSSLALVAIITPILFSSLTQYTNAQRDAVTVVRDSQIVLLEGLTIPANDYIHLYDTTPYMIKVGHVAAKLPCDSNSKTSLKLLIGQAPNLKPANLELVKELSKPGTMCIYHADIESSLQGSNGIVTDIALQNPTNIFVKFGPTATVVIGVDEIMAGAEAKAMGNMSMGNSTG